MDFSIFSKSLKGFANELHGLRTRIEQLERDREDVQFAPASRADVLAALEGWVQRGRDAYLRRLAGPVARLQHNAATLADPAAVDAILKANALTSSGGPHNPVFPYEADQALAGIFGEQLLDSLRAAVGGMVWPDGAGLPFAQRSAAVEKIDAQLVKLRGEEAKLVADAAKAGLQVD